jgi:hypothetical protein
VGTGLGFVAELLHLHEQKRSDGAVLMVQAIENLEQLTLLEELWLGKNKIRTLEVSSVDVQGRQSAHDRTCLLSPT